MASSVITIFRWSIFRVSSFAIILLWAFNPLGSQASFRGAYLRPHAGMSQGNITYYSPRLTIQLALSPFIGGSTPAIRAFYSTALYDYVARTQYVDPSNSVTRGIVTMMGGDKTVATQAAMDTWGNVRIPALQYLTEYDQDNPHQWVETPWDQKILNYSSLLGDRVDGVDRKSIGNTTFTIVSSSQHHSVRWRISPLVPQKEISLTNVVHTMVPTQQFSPNCIQRQPNKTVRRRYMVSVQYRQRLQQPHSSTLPTSHHTRSSLHRHTRPVTLYYWSLSSSDDLCFILRQ
jgi:hypothetical protein